MSDVDDGTLHQGKGYSQVYNVESDKDKDDPADHIPEEQVGSPTLPLHWSVERMGNTEHVLQKADALISNENSSNETFLLTEAAKTRLIDTGFTAQQKVTHHPLSASFKTNS